MTATRVSIVIPTYRRGKSLGLAIAALTAQTTPAHEILIIDQNPEGWLKSELGDVLDGTTVIWTEKANVSTARNLGFVLSKGDVVLFVDDDLVPDAGFLSRAVSRLEEFPEVGCLCPVIVTGEADLAHATRLVQAFAMRSHPRSADLLAMPNVLSAAMFFRRSTYERSGGFDEGLFDYARAGEDQELCFRMRKRGLIVWLDTALNIFHDETVAGGCDLRTRPFWESRERSIRAIVLRARLHERGRLKLPAMVGLLRSAFLNTNMFRKGPVWTMKNARLLAQAVVDTRRLVRARGEVPDVRLVDHIAPHRQSLPQSAK